MLTATDLTYRATPGTAPIFRQLNFSWPEDHAVIGLTGPSGSGKTTLARLLAGHRQPETGTVQVTGKPLPVNGPSPVQLALQSPELSVDPQWAVRRILSNGGQVDAELLQDLGIKPQWGDRRPAELSGGEQQRVAVARLLVPTTRYLLCDEVTASLDAIAQASFWDALLRVTRQRGLRVLVISHDIFLLESLSTRIFRIENLVSA